jgi:hypothetical protein
MDVERVRVSCVWNPKKSIVGLSLQLEIPKTVIQNELHMRMRLNAYKTKLRHGIKDNDPPKRI